MKKFKKYIVLCVLIGIVGYICFTFVKSNYNFDYYVLKAEAFMSTYYTEQIPSDETEEILKIKSIRNICDIGISVSVIILTFAVIGIVTSVIITGVNRSKYTNTKGKHYVTDANQLRELAKLRDEKIITDEEFEQKKKEILN